MTLSTHDVVSTMVEFALKARQETRNDLAKAMGVSVDAIGSRLRGRTRWSVDDIDQVAAHFEMSPADLVAGQLDARALAPVQRQRPLVVTARSRRRTIATDGYQSAHLTALCRLARRRRHARSTSWTR